MTIFPTPLKYEGNGFLPLAFSHLSLSAGYLTGLQTMFQSQGLFFSQESKEFIVAVGRVISFLDGTTSGKQL